MSRQHRRIVSLRQLRALGVNRRVFNHDIASLAQLSLAILSQFRLLSYLAKPLVHCYSPVVSSRLRSRAAPKTVRATQAASRLGTTPLRLVERTTYQWRGGRETKECRPPR